MGRGRYSNMVDMGMQRSRQGEVFLNRDQAKEHRAQEIENAHKKMKAKEFTARMDAQASNGN